MTEIYGTLGPACAAADTLENMLRRGMTGVRLNLSHVTLPEAAPQVEALREAAARSGVEPRLLIDMQGPELRIGALPEPVPLEAGETLSLGETIPLPQAVLEALAPRAGAAAGRRQAAAVLRDGAPGACAARRGAAQPQERGPARKNAAASRFDGQ